MKRETELTIGVPAIFAIDIIRELIGGHQGRIITAGEIKQRLGPLGLTRGQWNYAREVLVFEGVIQKTVGRGAYILNSRTELQSPMNKVDESEMLISEAALGFYQDSDRYHSRIRAEKVS